MSGIQLIVGLKNPGTKYADTRHNAGAWFLETLEPAPNFNTEKKFHGQHALFSLENKACHLLLPDTYMNESGLAVRAIAQFYKIPPEAILIAHDEIDLPAGLVRLKFDGGAGGHNGLRDIIDHLQSKRFHRLRIGVGHPGNSNAVVDYVLNMPSRAERKHIDESITRAQHLLSTIIAGDMAKAMQTLHTDTTL